VTKLQMELNTTTITCMLSATLFLQTSNSTMDVENSQGQRIGDKIALSGVSFRMMLELNERYSDVTFRMMVVRSARDDTPTSSTLWQGNSRSWTHSIAGEPQLFQIKIRA